MNGFKLGTDPDTGVLILTHVAEETRRQGFHGWAGRVDHVAGILKRYADPGTTSTSEEPATTDAVDGLISDRAKTHGDFQRNTVTAQGLKALIRSTPNWGNMPPAFQEALDMVCSKMARILHGDAEAVEHWEDMEGYPHLIVRMLR